MEANARPNWRRSRRWSIMWPATVVAPDGYQYQCTILDISEWGARVESEFSPVPIMKMKLQCYRFGSISGNVVWTRGKTAGIRFDVAPAEVAAVLKSIVPGLDRRGRLEPQSKIANRPTAASATPPGNRSRA